MLGDIWRRNACSLLGVGKMNVEAAIRFDNTKESLERVTAICDTGVCKLGAVAEGVYAIFLMNSDGIFKQLILINEGTWIVRMESTDGYAYLLTYTDSEYYRIYSKKETVK